jgi:hypothetical protein
VANPLFRSHNNQGKSRTLDSRNNGRLALNSCHLFLILSSIVISVDRCLHVCQPLSLEGTLRKADGNVDMCSYSPIALLRALQGNWRNYVWVNSDHIIGDTLHNNSHNSTEVRCVIAVHLIVVTEYYPQQTGNFVETLNYAAYTVPLYVTLADMAHWLWVKHAPGGSLCNYVAWQRPSSLLLCHARSITPSPFSGTRNGELRNYSNQLNTLIRKYYFIFYFVRHISAHIKYHLK